MTARELHEEVRVIIASFDVTIALLAKLEADHDAEGLRFLADVWKVEDQAELICQCRKTLGRELNDPVLAAGPMRTPTISSALAEYRSLRGQLAQRMTDRAQ